MSDLSFWEKLHSKRNQLFFSIRSSLAFQRGNYREQSEAKDYLALYGNWNTSQLSTFNRIEVSSGLANKKLSLEASTYLKNLETFWTLSQIVPKAIAETSIDILEVGCQDFSRALGIASYFRKSNSITGLEIDPFPILQNFFTRADKATYYASLISVHSNYLAQNFFSYSNTHDFILSFYPFVSANPALAWGLPAEIAKPELWAQAYSRCLNKNGHVLVVHQGAWEEEEFDFIRDDFPLTLVARKELKCPFYSMPHPPRVSLYQRT